MLKTRLKAPELFFFFDKVRRFSPEKTGTTISALCGKGNELGDRSSTKKRKRPQEKRKFPDQVPRHYEVIDPYMNVLPSSKKNETKTPKQRASRVAESRPRVKRAPETASSSSYPHLPAETSVRSFPLKATDSVRDLGLCDHFCSSWSLHQNQLVNVSENSVFLKCVFCDLK